MGLTAASGTMAGPRVIGAVNSLAPCPDIDAVVSVFGDANVPGGAGMLLEALAIASGTMASTGNRDDAFNESQKRACTDEVSQLQHLTRAMEDASSTTYSR